MTATIQTVAEDGLSATQPLDNAWGLHQGRVTAHTDGTLRVLYIRAGMGGMANWRVMRRAPAATVWTAEAEGLSQDDVALLRNPVTDIAHVVSWPNSIPTVTNLPGGAASVVPGLWETMLSSGRHYCASGIGADGMLWLKASVELPSSTPTSSTKTPIICGSHTPSAGWRWYAQMTEVTGNRCTYDYLLPHASGLLATAQPNLYKTAAGMPSSGNNYIFNGISQYRCTPDAVGSRLMIVPPRAVNTGPMPPTLRQHDAYVTRSGALLCTYWMDDPTVAGAAGLYLHSAATGSVKLGLPTYGYARVFDDATGRLWLLWTNLGTQLSQAVLYKMRIIGSSVLLEQPTDLSAAFAPYAIEGCPFLAVPRGGQSVDNVLHGVFVAGERKFVASKLDATPPMALNGQSILHFKVQLPA